MGKRSNFFFSLFIYALILMIPSAAIPATIDSSFRFSTIETDHFVIHFHQGLNDIAKRAAFISEDVHRILSPQFKWTPTEKTQIVLLDNTDFANGLTTVLPYNAIYIFTVSPLPDMTISEYDDWLEILIMHEYAHVLTMDPVRGYSAVMRKIFGKTLPGSDPLSLFLALFTTPPNLFMPYWWIEGIATWTETEFSSMGRGKGSYYEMVFRMAVLEDRIPRIDQINGDVPYWPGGSIPYMYGLLLEKYIARKYGKETLGKINITQAGRLPFFINGPPKKFTGKNYVYLYRDMVRALREEQTEKINKLKSIPLTQYRTIPFKGERLTNPRFSPDRRYLAVNRRDPHHHEDIVIVDAVTLKEVSTVRRLPSDHGMSWSPDGNKLYFTQADLRGSFNLYQDIYSYDIEKDSVERITRNLRAKEIDVSPDGSSIAFVKVENLRQNLAILSVGDKDTLEVVSGTEGPMLSGPRWSPDGQYIVYSRRDNRGNTSIELFTVKTKNTTTIVKDRHNNIYPTWSPDGRYVVFTSDRTGVYNLFAYLMENKQVFQVTHVLGGAFQADIPRSGDKIVFSAYHSQGYSIAEIPYDPSQWATRFSPEIWPLWGEEREKDPLPSIAKHGDVTGEDTEKKSVTITDKGGYSPVQTLLPKFWLPTLLSDHDGAVYGAFTAGQDVLGYHTYLIQAGYGVSNQTYYNVNYIYDRWYPSFFIKGYSLPVLYSEFFNDNYNYYERQSSLIAGVRIPLNFLESKYSFIGGYYIEKRQHLTAIRGRTLDGLEVYEGRRDNIFVGIEYDSTLKYPYSISREEGRNITLLHKNYSRGLGSGLSQREYSATYEEFMGIGRQHVVYLNLRGATSDGDLIAQQAFQLGGVSILGNEYPLRGFSHGFETGRSIVTASLEYRFPIKYILRGWNTKPLFWDRLHLAAFTDAGNVWGYKKGFHWDDFSVGIGAETRLDMVLGYKLKITPAVGIARGITSGGETRIYLTIYSDF